MSGVIQMAKPFAAVSDMRLMQEKQLERQDKTERAEKIRDLQPMSDINPQGGISVPNQDRYVHAEEPARAGIYQLAKDDAGNPKIVFQDPARLEDNKEAAAADSPKTAEPAKQPADEEVHADGSKKTPEDKKEEEICKVNTDRVDAEIKKLKQAKERLEQQMAQAADDSDKQQNLKEQLSRVSNELRTKDTDAYRRQHAVFSSSKKNGAADQ